MTVLATQARGHHDNKHAVVSDTGMDWAQANGVSDGINPTVNTLPTSSWLPCSAATLGFSTAGRPSWFLSV